MMTVRFPSGHFVTYNNANLLSYAAHAWELHSKKGGDWIASIQPSSGCLVEVTSPCRIGMADKREMLKAVSENLRQFTSYEDCKALAAIKRELQEFNRQLKRWK